MSINYCYLIVDYKTKNAVIVDPAWELNTIEQAMETYQANITAILLTHHHYDHINLAGKLAKKYHIPVFMSKTEIDFYNFQCHKLQAIDDESPFYLGSLLIQPIFTPGHTFGGISYLIDNHLFCGDTLFTEGCGMCYDKGADPAILFESIQKLKTKIAANIRIYPGHSYGQTPGKPFQYLIENNIYLQFDNKENFVSFRMRKNQKGLFNFK